MGKKIGFALGGLVLAGLLAALIVPGCFSLQKDPREIALGAPAPQVALLDLLGKPFSLEALRAGGKRPVLVFWRGPW